MDFWTYFRNRLSEDDLKYIACADYGRDLEDNDKAVRNLIENEDISSLKYWHPREVVELIRWNPPNEIEAPAITFCSSVLILGLASKETVDYFCPINDNLIISIDCHKYLDEQYKTILLEIVCKMEMLPRETFDEEAPFVHLAKAIIENYLNQSSEETINKFVHRVEEYFKTGDCAVEPPKTIFDLSFFDQSNDLWKEHIIETGLIGVHKSLII